MLNSNKKREITHNEEQVNDSKSFKRIKTSNDIATNAGSVSNGSSSTSTTSNAQGNETILIEIDEVDEDDDDDTQIDDVWDVDEMEFTIRKCMK